MSAEDDVPKTDRTEGSQKNASPRSVVIGNGPIKVTKAGRVVQAALARIDQREAEYAALRSRTSSENSSVLSISPSRSPARKSAKIGGSSRKKKRLQGYHEQMVSDMKHSFDDAVERTRRREERRRQELQKQCYDLGTAVSILSEVDRHLMEAADNNVAAVQKRHAQRWERKWQDWSARPLGGPRVEEEVKLPPIQASARRGNAAVPAAAMSPQVPQAADGPSAPKSTRWMRRKYSGLATGHDRQHFQQMATLLAQVDLNNKNFKNLSCWQNGRSIPTAYQIPLGEAIELN